MPKLRAVSSLVFLAVSSVFGLPACSDDESGAAAQEGVEGGPCFPNDTCNDALICRSNLCVNPDPAANGDGDAGGDGDTAGAGLDLAGCFSCGETSCSAENDACAASSGCRPVLECWLECAGDAACQTNCDASGVTAEDLGTISAYFSCFAVQCIDECAASADAGGTSTGTSGAATGTSGAATGTTTGGTSTGTTTGGTSTGTTGGANLVENGTFVDELDKWNLELQAGATGTYSDTGGEVCVNNTQVIDMLSFTLGYPSDSLYSFAVEAGASYVLTYRARGYGSLETKVGQAVSPWGTIQSFNELVSSSLMTSYSHTVTPTGSEAYAGLAFNVVLDAGDSVCFDDVSFTKL